VSGCSDNPIGYILSSMTIKKLHGVTVLVLFVLAIIASVVGLVAHDEWMHWE
jgi:hypothetical protein